MQYRALSNGVELPMIGYGTFQIQDAAQCEQCVSEALEAGYRLIDTAASYGNEAAIGAALRGSGLPGRSCSSPPSSGCRTPGMTAPCGLLTSPASGSGWTLWTCT